VSDIQNINKQITDVIALEKQRCFQDPIHMLKKHCKIEHPLKGKIPFHLYPFQEETLRAFNEHRFNIVGKARQMGISTLCAGHVIYNMLSKESYKVLIIATTQKVAQELFLKIKVMYDGLPSWLKKDAQIVNNNSTQLTLTNGSSVEAVSSNPDAARSKALSLLIIDEAAFILSFEKIWTSAQSTLATGGNAIILSTPNGASGLFYQLWTNAIEGKTPDGLEKFNPIKLKWDLHPERDQKWRDQQDELAGSARAAAQENDVSFEASGHTVVNPEDLQWYEKNTVRDPIEKRGREQEYWLWGYPLSGRNYVVAVDVGRGDSADFSAIQVIDVEAKEQVAEWKGKVGTTELAQIAISVASEWNMALLAIENSNIGWATVQEAINLNYDNLYYTFRQDPYIDPNIHIAKNYDLKDKQDMVPGHTTSPKSRPTMIGKLQTATCKSSRYLTYHSERLHNELKAFKWINGKAQADSGYSDDLVLAMCIALFVIDTSMKLKSLGIDLTRKALTNIKRVVYKPSRTIGMQYTMKVGGRSESITWLL
jgi:hypothetical protein